MKNSGRTQFIFSFFHRIMHILSSIFYSIVLNSDEPTPKSKSYFISDYHRQFGDNCYSLCLLQNHLSFYYLCAPVIYHLLKKRSNDNHPFDGSTDV